ncbi:MAG: hypothetical protein J5548_11630 [Prevotella sp.]|nr:hypothetical protein [Prevotella sp.]
MKNKWMMLAGLLLVGVLAMFYLMRERHFIWDMNTRFQTDDDEPFGSELFDKMAEATLPNGYRVFDGDFEELLATNERCALLLVYTDLPQVSIFYEELEKFAKKGNKVMLVCDGTHYYAEETCFDTYVVNNFSLEVLKKELTGEEEMAKVVVNAKKKETLEIPETLLGRISSSPNGVKHTSYKFAGSGSFSNDLSYNLSYEINVGKGMAYFVSSPLLFTNYGVLDKNISRYLAFQMGQLADLPVVRVSYNSQAQYNYAHGANNRDRYDSRGSSPLSHMLKYQPLRWALYTMLCVALIFMFFTARHRQRVIPVVKKPVNRNMEFVRLLGTIYYRRHDNHDLFLKKYTYFKEELRRSQMIDLDDERMREGNARMLALRTKTEEEDMAKTLELLRTMAEAVELGNEQLLECIQKIDDIQARL